MSFCSVFIPCKDKKEAKKIARTLLKARLAACANILGGIESLFRWKGTIEAAQEVLLILKTRLDCVPDLIKTVENLHSYECPVIEVLPIQAGNDDFLQWIDRETR